MKLSVNTIKCDITLDLILYTFETSSCLSLGQIELIKYLQFSFTLTSSDSVPVPRVRWRRPKCGLITPPHLLSWPCVSDLLTDLKGESWLRAVTLNDSTPQWRISELRVWSYEPFIVPASSSSGSTCGQNLEVLYIIRDSIWNIFKIVQYIIKKYEIVLKQKLDTVSYLEE